MEKQKVQASLDWEVFKDVKDLAFEEKKKGNQVKQDDLIGILVKDQLAVIKHLRKKKITLKEILNG
jgi:hypothetical protein